MIYILNTNLQDKKPVGKALSSIFGIGDSLSKQICDDLGVSTSLKVDQLSPSQVDVLNQAIPQIYLIGAELQGDIRKRKERLVLISTYRGIRYSQGLPARGQRTHGNARTSRKGRLFVSNISGKRSRSSTKSRNKW